ncbi:MAG: SURF1 family cytochrome oxidase biogenesis protein [Ilumatobacteraceae bacterium]
MYGFLLRPRWLAFHLLVIVAVVVMVNLAFWQLRRLDERHLFNDTVVVRIDAEPVPIGELLAEPGFDPDGAEWRPVLLEGTYLPDQLLVFNRSQDGRAGDNALTPLQLDESGLIVLVNRGFIPLGAETPPPPETAVEVLGRARPSEQCERGGLTDADDGPLTEVRRVEIDRIAAQLDGDVAPMYVDLVAQEPAVGPGDPTPVPRPDVSSGPHLSYAIQWFIFSICVAVGWVLAVRRSIGKRRTPPAVTDEATSPAATDSPPPAGAASASSPSGTGNA